MFKVSHLGVEPPDLPGRRLHPRYHPGHHLFHTLQYWYRNSCIHTLLFVEKFILFSSLYNVRILLSFPSRAILCTPVLLCCAYSTVKWSYKKLFSAKQLSSFTFKNLTYVWRSSPQKRVSIVRVWTMDTIWKMRLLYSKVTKVLEMGMLKTLAIP